MYINETREEGIHFYSYPHLMLAIGAVFIFIFILFIRKWTRSPSTDIETTFIHTSLQSNTGIQWHSDPSIAAAIALHKPLTRINNDGKSNSDWFSTHDKKYLLKSLTPANLADLMEFLPHLKSHIDKYPDSLLPRCHGVFTVSNQHYIIIENLFYSRKISRKFDFKGCNINRESLSSISSSLSQDTTLKELDYDRLLSEGLIQPIQVGPLKDQLMQQLSLDTNLLKDNGFIDYSLLVGVYNHPRRILRRKLSMPNVISSVSERMTRVLSYYHQEGPSDDLEKQSLLSSQTIRHQIPFHQQFKGGIRSYGVTESRDIEYQIYYIGIIDILTKFTFMKRIERGLKRHFSVASAMGSNVSAPGVSGGIKRASLEYGGGGVRRTSLDLGLGGAEPSAEEPPRYASRLVDFIDKVLV